jgi:phosphoribosylformylglycinamidine (FGAM) synthase PurS component
MSGKGKYSRSKWKLSQKIKQIIPELADKVLANPIIEKFTWEIID